MDIKVPWGALKAQVAEHEKNGATLKDLSKEEGIAFSYLVDFTKEPEFEEANYVGELLELYQARQGSLPSFEFRGPLEIPVKGIFELRWYCVCVLPDSDTTVPNDPFGIEGETPISFRAKKKAKTYAAREALKLVKGHSIPRQSNFAKPRAQSTTTRAEDPCNERIAALVKELGMSTPKFVVWEHPPTTGLFGCRAVFDALATVPEDVGNIEGIAGKERALMESAKAVERWMTHELHRRNEFLTSAFS